MLTWISYIIVFSQIIIFAYLGSNFHEGPSCHSMKDDFSFLNIYRYYRLILHDLPYIKATLDTQIDVYQHLLVNAHEQFKRKNLLKFHRKYFFFFFFATTEKVLDIFDCLFILLLKYFFFFQKERFSVCSRHIIYFIISF